MALSATLIALMNFFARLASSSAGWATVATVRAAVGALVGIAVARARASPLATADKKGLLYRCVFGTAAMLCTFYALSSRTLGLGDTATLINLMPVLLAVLSPIFLRERTSVGVGLGIAIALAGVVLVVRPSYLFGGEVAVRAGAAGPSARTTAIAAMLAALFASFAMMALRRLKTERAEAVAVHYSVFAAVVLGGLAAFDLRTPTARDAACMLAAGVTGGFGQIAMTRAYALGRAARVSAMSYLAVIVSAALGAMALGERPRSIALAGMALVIGGGVMVTFARRG